MVGFSSLFVAFIAIGASLAAPVDTLIERSPEDFFVNSRELGNLHRRQNYIENYTTGGTVDFSPSSTGFSVTWDTPDDFIVGKGWSVGGSSSITYDGSFSASSGTALLSIYGWTLNPLVEYYIIESNNLPPSFGIVKGSVISDGSEYIIYAGIPPNDPPISGTAPFYQYYSVRSSQRTSGIVTVENHFNAWKRLGLELGTYNYQIVAVEASGGAGSASLTVHPLIELLHAL